jgi:hypothetical protein
VSTKSRVGGSHTLDRSQRAQDLLRADQEHRERMLEQIYRVIFEFAGDFGVNRQGALRAFRKAGKTAASSPYRLQQAVHFQTLLQISEILGAWYREPAYVNEMGDPRPLPIAGAKSFASLVRRFLPQFRAREIADILIAERLLERNSTGEVVPLRRTAMFANANTMMLDRVPALLRGLASTLCHNTRPAGEQRHTRCERGTTIDRLPVELIPAFNAHVKKLAQSLLNQTDSWADQRQLPEGTRLRKPVARVGVEVFAFVETDQGTLRRGRSP